jgi:hypothetical protein
MNPVEREWLETTPGERFKIQTSSSDTGGAYLVFEVEAVPRIGVPPTHMTTKRSTSSFLKVRFR